MTETPTDVALGYVKEQLDGLRTSMQDELAAIRSDLSAITSEMRSHMAEHGPRVAVLEHRVAQAEQNLANLQAARTRDRGLRWALLVAIIGAVLGWVPTLVTLTGG
ncbi:hypothetical protein SAMN04487819_11659 [Actinopolyspora alba]|uniref:Uncharacterized protein n=1 Tax=Actinopolyspora alba TaxID=673379 RepID=A0A1I2BE79_9ACTN|nr:hypothetical protein [Actinopolyspora alba]SFE54471.1 hypothetical protein SAMN04487819_11659 [Actinopolyspora alba]